MSSGGSLRLLLWLLLAVALGACALPSSRLDSFREATVLIEHAKGHGTGTIVGPQEVLTAYHVVQETPLDVTFFGGAESAGEVVWYDEARDLALVHVQVPAGYRVPELTCSAPRAGEDLVVVGHPTHSRWVTVGGHLPTSERLGRGGLVALGFPIRLGTSGGPVFDESGRVIGIAMAILAERTSTSAGYDQYSDTGIGLMLPVRDFCDVLVAEHLTQR
jgi:serine protease Do